MVIQLIYQGNHYKEVIKLASFFKNCLAVFICCFFAVSAQANITYFFSNAVEDPPVVQKCKEQQGFKWCGTCCDLSTHECEANKCCKKAGDKPRSCVVLDGVNGCTEWVDKKCPTGLVCHLETEECVACYWDNDCLGNKSKCDKGTNTCVCSDDTPIGADAETCRCPDDYPDVIDGKCQKCEDEEVEDGLVCSASTYNNYMAPLEKFYLRKFRFPESVPVGEWWAWSIGQYGGNNPMFAGTVYQDVWNGFNIACKGTINIPVEGTYSFSVWADNYIYFTIGGVTFAETDWQRGPKIGSVYLPKGENSVTLAFGNYFDGAWNAANNPYSFRIDWAGPGFGWSKTESFSTTNVCTPKP